MFAVLQGIGMLTGVAAVFIIGQHAGWPEDRTRAIAFTTIVVGNLACIVVNRSPSHNIFALLSIPNPTQWWVLGGACVALAAILILSGLRSVFHFSPVDAGDAIYPIGVGTAAIAWSEMLKHWLKNREWTNTGS